MARKSSIFYRISQGFIGFGLTLLMSIPMASQASILDDLCQLDSNAPIAMEALVEEAEATGMPASTLKRLLVKGYQDDAATRELARLLCIIIQAEEDGLPPDLLFVKVEEGLAKRVTLANITPVIADKVDDMRYAQSLISAGVEPQLEDDNVTRIVKAMSAGLTRQELQKLFDPAYTVPVDMRVVAAEIKAYGNTIGYDTQLLDQIVTTGLKSTAFSEDWAYLIKLISKAKKQNITDQRIAQEAINTLSQRGTLNDLITSLGMDPRDVY